MKGRRQRRVDRWSGDRRCDTISNTGPIELDATRLVKLRATPGEKRCTKGSVLTWDPLNVVDDDAVHRRLPLFQLQPQLVLEGIEQ